MTRPVRSSRSQRNGCFSNLIKLLVSCVWPFKKNRNKIHHVYNSEVVDAKEAMVRTPSLDETPVAEIHLRPEHSETRLQRNTTVLRRLHSAEQGHGLPGADLLRESADELSEEAGQSGRTTVQVIKSRDDFNNTYSEVRHLNEGGYGNVFAGIRKDDGLPVAVKHIPAKKVCWLPQDTDGEIYQLPLEVHLMQLAAEDEPEPKGIIQLLDWYASPDEVILVIERPPVCMDLFDFIEARGRHIKEHEAKHIMKQLIKTVLHVHRRGVVHRDIKTENILIAMSCESVRVRLIDFGCARMHHEQPYFSNCVGTGHTPPEWFLTCTYHAEPCTTWQLGVVLFEMTCGEKPFFSRHEVVNMPPIFPIGLSKQCRDLLQRCLAKDPIKRATLEEIEQHPFLL